MIVRSFANHVELITQPDHAHLAARIMDRCTALAQHPRRARILRAVGEHDNGWTEEDAAPGVDSATGGVVDFVAASLRIRHAVWPRGVARLTDDPWAGALVAHHAVTVYDRFRSQSDWTPFFDGMTARRDALVQKSALSLDVLAEDYVFVRLGDLISLAFCTGWTGEHQLSRWTVRPSESRVVVTPDLFGGAVVPIEVEAKTLPKIRFDSDADLHREMAHAQRVTLTGTVTGEDAAT